MSERWMRVAGRVRGGVGLVRTMREAPPERAAWQEWHPARADARFVGRCGDHLKEVLRPFTSVRDVYVVPGTVEHYRQAHGTEFDLACAEERLAGILADPDAVYRGAKPNSIVFVGRHDEEHLLILPVKALSGEMWVQSLYVARSDRFARRGWVLSGLLYRKHN